MKLTDAEAILSDSGECITFNVDTLNGVTAIPVFVDTERTDMDALRSYFDRHE